MEKHSEAPILGLRILQLVSKIGALRKFIQNSIFEFKDHNSRNHLFILAPPSYAEAKHISPDPHKFSKSKKKSQKRGVKGSQERKAETIVFSPLYAVFDLSNQVDEMTLRANEPKTDGGYVNEGVEKSTWL